MSDKLSVLMTVYNEGKFIEYAIRSCLPHIDHLVIVEGAYQETIALGANPRSTDGTLDICQKYKDEKKVHLIEYNGPTDKDHRNVGLGVIQNLNPDGWCLIIDGDEVYDEDNLKMVKIAMNNMEKSNKYAAYFKSLTFVNDFDHYTEQDFPRLFKVTPKAKFVNDNFMTWEDKGIGWYSPYVIKIPYIRYHHYSFCKGKERFELKKKWWETRFGKEFDYGWHIDETGQINDPNHDINVFNGKHPKIIEDLIKNGA